MTRVCLLGSDDTALRQTLLSHETARRALRTYDLTEPFRNTVGIETVSLGAAVTLLNDLEWYLVRYTDAALVLEPSVSDTEWLSRDLATAIRDDRIDPAASDRYLKVYGVESTDDSSTDEPDGAESSPSVPRSHPPRLVEPMYVTRAGDSVPDYDLRDVSETVVVRITEAAFGN